MCIHDIWFVVEFVFISLNPMRRLGINNLCCIITVLLSCTDPSSASTWPCMQRRTHGLLTQLSQNHRAFDQNETDDTNCLKRNAIFCPAFPASGFKSLSGTFLMLHPHNMAPNVGATCSTYSTAVSSTSNGVYVKNQTSATIIAQPALLTIIQ